MIAEAIGVAAAAALWVGAFVVTLRAQQAAVRTAPIEWRERPELREPYAQLLDPGPWQISWRSWMRLGIGTAVAFVAIGLLDFERWFVLLYTVTLALVWTASEYGHQRELTRRFAAEHDLPLRPRRLHLRIAYYAGVFFLWLGYYGIAAFAGALLADAIT